MGKIKGLSIKPGEQLLHQLFADDTGVFFKSTEENFHKVTLLIALYECISGAKLNLHKSVLIQLNNSPPLDWFSRVGSKIAVRGEIIKYLGCPINFNLSPNKIPRFLLDKFRKRLCHWSNRLLSMAGRLVLLRHMVCSIPIYYFMLLDLTQDGFKTLETMYREFLWGLGSEGNPRIPLITWENVTNPKLMGGLGLTNFQTHAKALKIRSISKLFEYYDSEWVLLP